MTRKFLIGGNWKCNGTKDSITDLCKSFNEGEKSDHSKVDVVVFPTFLHTGFARELLRKDWQVGVQNCWIGKPGAFTGEVSASLIKDFGVEWVLLGHSERRHLPELKESDETVAKKVQFALENSLKVMLCVGETLDEREAGHTDAVNERQLAAVIAKIKPESWNHIAIAYEPVWAIGTGKTATPEIAQTAHANIRAYLKRACGDEVANKVQILYGGSVTDANCDDLAKQPDIDGFLVGGASLKKDFLKIVASYKVRP
eukprot:CAMPEP_0184692212 /NCGR_PEP_ID=MMETSP0313-20130426/781_1 /TAXON_ID=2792 /ORGANISM="Porphyridium aerugineum, Strain SAG 1380-2" /LENGTH=256 /DNA_ID=CAMNT_0027150025 /DNA_START=1901 /DNA_END=2671 /DNA_ORIENTATION=-